MLVEFWIEEWSALARACLLVTEQLAEWIVNAVYIALLLS